MLPNLGDLPLSVGNFEAHEPIGKAVQSSSQQLWQSCTKLADWPLLFGTPTTTQLIWRMTRIRRCSEGIWEILFCPSWRQIGRVVLLWVFLRWWIPYPLRLVWTSNSSWFPPVNIVCKFSIFVLVCCCAIINFVHIFYDDVLTWKNFPRNGPFVREITSDWWLPLIKVQ